MTESSWLSLLPPLLAIISALVTRQVYLSLFAGIWLGWFLLADYQLLTALALSIQASVDVFADSGNTRVILFSVLIGSLIALIQASGGVAAFVSWASRNQQLASRKGAQWLAIILGLGVFIESSLTCLVSGSVARPLFDKYRISREKLAWLCDSTSAPVCMLIPFNGWGALVLALLLAQGVENGLGVFALAIPLSFYPIFTLILVFILTWRDRNYGPMLVAEQRVTQTGAIFRDGAEPLISSEITNIEPLLSGPYRIRNMLLPLVIMVFMIPVSLWVTGDGQIVKGSGSTSVLWAVMTAIAVASILYLGQKLFSLKEVMDLIMKGMSGMLPVAVILLLALALGATTKELGTGQYLAAVLNNTLNPVWLPVLVFLLSAAIAFATGTSWGTFALIIPLVVPLAMNTVMPMPLLVAATLSGGVFGDHCSPISDTTIISSMAAGSDHMDHVRTQLPYALTAAFFSSIAFIIAGMLSAS